MEQSSLSRYRMKDEHIVSTKGKEEIGRRVRRQPCFLFAADSSLVAK
jgi:hypothetical protein